MAFRKGQNPNHPKIGSATKVEPIRKKKDIEMIKGNLRNKPRDYCLFVLGINTAYRANELLSIKVDQVAHLTVGDRLEIKQSKNNRYRAVTLNKAAIGAIEILLDSYPYTQEDYLFYSQRAPRLGVPEVSHKVKNWCADLRLPGNYGSHTLRKTWGYWQYQRNTPIPLLMQAFGHQTQQQTMQYLGIQDKDIQEIFAMEL